MYVLPLLVPLLRLAALRLAAAARRLGLLRQLVDALLEELEAVGRVGRGRPLRRVRVGRGVVVVVDLVVRFRGVGRVAGRSEVSPDGEPVDVARQLVERRVSDRGRGELSGLGTVGTRLALHSRRFSQRMKTLTEKEKGGGDTYVKEELAHVPLVVLLLEVDVAEGVDDEDLAVLGDDSLLGARGARARRCLHGHGRRAPAPAGLLLADASRAGGAARALPFLAGVLARLLLLHPALLAVQGDGGLLLLLLLFVGGGLRLRWRGLRRGRSGGGVVESRDGEVVAPGGVPRELDVALDELALAPPAHVQGDVVEAAAADEQAADEDGAEAGAVPAVVVLGALPGGEAVPEEVVVADAPRAAEDVGDDSEAGLALAGLLDGGLELGGLDALALGLDAALLFGAVGHDLLAHLVRVQRARLALVRLVDLVLRC